MTKKLRVNRDGLELDAKQAVLGEAIIEGTETGQYALSRDTAAVDNVIPLVLHGEAEGVRIRMLHMMQDTDKDVEALIKQFREYPVLSQALCRLNLIRLSKDPAINEADHETIMRLFIEAYLNLVLQLDHRAFPARELIEGMPNYIPDMFTDFGMDPREEDRDWEKYCVAKQDVFNIHADTLFRILTTDMTKVETVERLALAVRRKRTYAEPTDIARNGDGILPKEALEMFQVTVSVQARHDVGIGVCRHDALDFQVLAQIAGIESRVLPCTYEEAGESGYHLVNLVRIKGRWFIVDVTNSHDNKLFMKPLPKGFDPDNKTLEHYRWAFENNRGREIVYFTHNKTFNKVLSPDHKFREPLPTDTIERMRVLVLGPDDADVA